MVGLPWPTERQRAEAITGIGRSGATRSILWTTRRPLSTRAGARSPSSGSPLVPDRARGGAVYFERHRDRGQAPVARSTGSEPGGQPGRASRCASTSRSPKPWSRSRPDHGQYLAVSRRRPTAGCPAGRGTALGRPDCPGRVRRPPWGAPTPRPTSACRANRAVGRVADASDPGRGRRPGSQSDHAAAARRRPSGSAADPVVASRRSLSRSISACRPMRTRAAFSDRPAASRDCLIRAGRRRARSVVRHAVSCTRMLASRSRWLSTCLRSVGLRPSSADRRGQAVGRSARPSRPRSPAPGPAGPGAIRCQDSGCTLTPAASAARGQGQVVERPSPARRR